MGVLGESTEQPGLGSTPREDDLTAQIAARKVQLHPAHRIGNNHIGGIRPVGLVVGRLRLAGIEHLQIITRRPERLVVVRQLGTMLGDPGFERLVFECIIRFGELPGTRDHRQKAGDEEHGAHEELHNCSLRFNRLDRR